MSTIKNVALAGASGSLGAPILTALLNANLTVTVLVRLESPQVYEAPVKTAKVDYNDASSLEAALSGQDAVISAVGYAAFQGQKALFDAAIAKGVKRIIPSEYGTDPEVPEVRRLPVFEGKVRVEEYVKEQTKGTSTTYTLVADNEFLDWDLDHKFGVDVATKKIEIFDGGDVVHTATPLEFVARGIVGVLQHPEETANRVVRLHGAALTQNKLLATIQKFTGKEGWQVTHASTFDREREGFQNLHRDPSNWLAWGIPFLQVAVWGERFGGNFSKNNDNELLGLKELTDAEVEEIVKKRI